MAENVFEAVKQSVSTREAAEFYGIKVSRTGMACCPFHDDKNPSMKVDQRFHCFGCGADGDVIDFTAKLFNLSPKEAAEKLAQDFGLIYDSQAPPRRRYVRQKTEAQKFREDRQRCYRVLSDYYHLLKNGRSTILPGHRRKNCTPVLWKRSRRKLMWSTCWTFFCMKVKKNKGHGLQNTQQKSHTWKGD